MSARESHERAFLEKMRKMNITQQSVQCGSSLYFTIHERGRIKKKNPKLIFFFFFFFDFSYTQTAVSLWVIFHVKKAKESVDIWRKEIIECKGFDCSKKEKKRKKNREIIN